MGTSQQPATDKVYTTQILDQTAYDPTSDQAGFIEYLVKFTNNADPSDTFQQRVDADGSDLDFQNECRKFLETKFAPPPEDHVNPAHQFSVGATINVVA